MYDESQALAYIRAHAPEAAAYPDDELLNIIDMIWDYYESNGMLDPDIDDDDDADDDPETLAAALVDYAGRMLRRDKGSHFDPAHLPAVIAAELEYEQSAL